MEDFNVTEFPFADNEKRAFFAVFDGHAGKDAAKAATEIVPTEFYSQIGQVDQSADYTETLKQTFLVADEQMKVYEYEGCTATVVYIWEFENHRYLQCANVGDSAAYLCREGEAIPLTVDHNPKHQWEKDRIRASGLTISDNSTRINGLAVSRSLGDIFIKNLPLGLIAEPSVSASYCLGDTDQFLIVASDGLWDIITGQRAYEIIQTESDVTEMAKKLMKTALASSSCTDNVTIIVAVL